MGDVSDDVMTAVNNGMNGDTCDVTAAVNNGVNGDTCDVHVVPFEHQVGGHTCVFRVTSKIICKPCQRLEVLFYQSAAKEFSEFIPQYLGKGCSTIKYPGEAGDTFFNHTTRPYKIKQIVIDTTIPVLKKYNNPHNKLSFAVPPRVADP